MLLTVAKDLGINNHLMVFVDGGDTVIALNSALGGSAYRVLWGLRVRDPQLSD
jgi:hypothetical protein